MSITGDAPSAFLVREIILLSLAVLSCSSPEEDALIVCQRAVRGELRAPSTAVFASVKESKVEKLRSSYVVSSSVESQNALGVPLRSEFLCQIQGGTVLGQTIVATSVATREECNGEREWAEMLPDTLGIKRRLDILQYMPECAFFERAK